MSGPPAVRYLVQGEYDYARSVEVEGDAVRAFAGSYVTHGEHERTLSRDERKWLNAALGALPEPFDRNDDGASLRHTLQVGDRTWAWRGGPDDAPAALRPLLDLLARLTTPA